MNDKFSLNLAALIEADGRPKNAIAKAVGVQPPALSRWLKGAIPDGKHLASLSKVLNVSVNKLLNAEAKDPAQMVERKESFSREPMLSTMAPSWIPVISWAHAGNACSYEELPPHWQEYIPTICKSPDTFALSIEGDSMLPYCREGDVAVVMPHELPRNGCLVVAKLKNDGVVLRRFSQAKNTIRLTPNNPIYLPTEHNETDFHWIYPVHSTVRREWA